MGVFNARRSRWMENELANKYVSGATSYITEFDMELNFTHLARNFRDKRSSGRRLPEISFHI